MRTIAESWDMLPTTKVAVADFVAGASASCIAQVVIVPVDVVSQAREQPLLSWSLCPLAPTRSEGNQDARWLPCARSR